MNKNIYYPHRKTYKDTPNMHPQRISMADHIFFRTGLPLAVSVWINATRPQSQILPNVFGHTELWIMRFMCTYTNKFTILILTLCKSLWYFCRSMLIHFIDARLVGKWLGNWFQSYYFLIVIDIFTIRFHLYYDDLCLELYFSIFYRSALATVRLETHFCWIHLIRYIRSV